MSKGLSALWGDIVDAAYRKDRSAADRAVDGVFRVVAGLRALDEEEELAILNADSLEGVLERLNLPTFRRGRGPHV